eukprot:710356-Pyramimonas_sp.AAC.1
MVLVVTDRAATSKPLRPHRAVHHRTVLGPRRPQAPEASSENGPSLKSARSPQVPAPTKIGSKESPRPLTVSIRTRFSLRVGLASLVGPRTASRRRKRRETENDEKSMRSPTHPTVGSPHRLEAPDRRVAEATVPGPEG